MSLTLRNIKGSPLTYTELDDNLEYLEGLGLTANGQTLEDILSNGNTSGTFSIEMGSGTQIKSPSGNDYLNFNSGGNLQGDGSLNLSGNDYGNINVVDSIRYTGTRHNFYNYNDTTLNLQIDGFSSEVRCYSDLIIGTPSVIKSNMADPNRIDLNNGIDNEIRIYDSGLNVIRLSPNNGLNINGSPLNIFSETDISIKSSDDVNIGRGSVDDIISIQKNSFSNATTTNTTKTPTFISTQNSTINTGVENSVILGGTGLTADTSNTVYMQHSVNTGVAQFAEYTVSTVPTASSYSGGMIAVTDEVGGYTMVFSDGTDWRRVNDPNIVQITYSGLQTLKTDSELVPNTTYHITDRDIWIKALDVDNLSNDGIRLMRCPIETYYTPQTISGTPDIFYLGIYGQVGHQGDIPVSDGTTIYRAIWGGKLWERDTSGADGGTTVQDIIDGGGWTQVVTTDSTYEDCIFSITYNFDDDIIGEQRDWKGNVIYNEVNPSDTSSGTNTVDITDWNNSDIYDNKNLGIYNNYNKDNDDSQSYIFDNNNYGVIYNNSIYGNISNNSNNGDIYSNVQVSYVAFGDIINNKNNGDIYSNTNGGLINNNSNDNSIYDNSNSGKIEFNFNGGLIFQNSNTGDIIRNSNDGWIRLNSCNSILYNSNLGNVSGNSNSGTITNNSNLGNVSSNSNSGTITNNSNLGQISFNSNDGVIRNNSNNGPIQGNSSDVGTTFKIQYNQNNGFISNNNSTDNIDIQYNQNNGSIGDAFTTQNRATTIEDTQVDK